MRTDPTETEASVEKKPISVTSLIIPISACYYSERHSATTTLTQEFDFNQTPVEQDVHTL
jgi:hypothetical protein